MRWGAPPPPPSDGASSHRCSVHSCGILPRCHLCAGAKGSRQRCRFGAGCSGIRSASPPKPLSLAAFQRVERHIPNCLSAVPDRGRCGVCHGGSGTLGGRCWGWGGRIKTNPKLKWQLAEETSAGWRCRGRPALSSRYPCCLPGAGVRHCWSEDGEAPRCAPLTCSPPCPSPLRQGLWAEATEVPERV